MISNNLSVEDIVKARCPNCREIRNHTVIEVATGRAARVQCNSCREICTYSGKKNVRSSPVKTAGGKKAPPSRRSREAQAATERAEWASLRPAMHPEKAVVYSMTGTYHARDLVQHLSFGLGLVTREAGPQKIEVLFEDGKKLLCCH